IQAELTKGHHGTDVTLSCEVSDLQESSTVQWEREEAPVPNSTLFYNNTAYIILHNIDHRSQGKYYCTLRHRGKKVIYRNQTLEVSKDTHTHTKYILYRESSNSSNLALICKSKRSFDRIMWIRQLNQTEEVMIAAERAKNLSVHGVIVPAKHSSTFYNGTDFIFHISPVKFSYSGTYRCLVNDKTYSFLTLHTLRVFAEPTVMVWKQSVVLTCEVSDVTERVILVWLKMEGNSAVLIKQEVLTQRDMTRSVSVTLNSVCEHQLHCQCAVFTEDTLRALAPITLHLVPSLRKEPHSVLPKHTTALLSQGIRVEEGSDAQTVVTVVFIVSGCLGVLLGALLFFRQRRPSTDVPSVIEMKCRVDPCNSNSAQGTRAEEEKEEKGEELHYASITIVEQGASGNCKRNKMPGTSDSVIYSTVNVK
ncbi:hypothetical protein AMELA_G00089270, partial [Ameiurus melas]